MKKLIKVRYNSILMIINRFMKDVYFILYKETLNTDDLIYMMMRYIFINHGVLREIMLNRDKLFILKF